jgi:hypothetical protein
MPMDSAVKYETALKNDKVLLIVHGAPDVVDKAKDIIVGARLGTHTVHGEIVLNNQS